MFRIIDWFRGDSVPKYFYTYRQPYSTRTIINGGTVESVIKFTGSHIYAEYLSIDFNCIVWKICKFDEEIKKFKSLKKCDVTYSLSAKYQDWFCQRYPDCIDKVNNLNPKIRDRYSHLLFGDKFRCFIKE